MLRGFRGFSIPIIVIGVIGCAVVNPDLYIREIETSYGSFKAVYMTPAGYDIFLNQCEEYRIEEPARYTFSKKSYYREGEYDLYLIVDESYYKNQERFQTSQAILKKLIEKKQVKLALVPAKSAVK